MNLGDTYNLLSITYLEPCATRCELHMRLQTEKRFIIGKIKNHLLAAFSGAIVVLVILGAPAVSEAHPEDSTLPDHFGRMFNLPPFAPPTDAVRTALLELGKPGGILDAKTI
jgi:hypothetical protein